MLLEQAVRYSEIILAFAYAQQSLEYIRGLQPEKTWGVIRLLLSLLLLMGFQPVLVEAGLLVVGCVLLFSFSVDLFLLSIRLYQNYKCRLAKRPSAN
jgi:hypothetical protein